MFFVGGLATFAGFPTTFGGRPTGLTARVADLADVLAVVLAADLAADFDLVAGLGTTDFVAGFTASGRATDTFFFFGGGDSRSRLLTPRFDRAGSTFDFALKAVGTSTTTFRECFGLMMIARGARARAWANASLHAALANKASPVAICGDGVSDSVEEQTDVDEGGFSCDDTAAISGWSDIGTLKLAARVSARCCCFPVRCENLPAVTAPKTGIVRVGEGTGPEWVRERRRPRQGLWRVGGE